MDLFMLLCLAAIPLVLVLVISPPLRDRLIDAVGRAQGWLLVLAWVPVALLAVVLIDDDLLPAATFATLLVGCLAIWIQSFALLMRQPDDAFPGRYDKPIWALLLIVLPPVGVVAFWSYRRGHGPEPVDKPVRAATLRDWS